MKSTSELNDRLNPQLRTGRAVSFALWARRWMIALAALVLLLFSRFDPFWMGVFVFAVVLDVWVTPEAIDLRIDDASLIQAIKLNAIFGDVAARRSKWMVCLFGLVLMLVFGTVCGVARFLLVRDGFSDAAASFMSWWWASAGVTLGLCVFHSWFWFEVVTDRTATMWSAFSSHGLLRNQVGDQWVAQLSVRDGTIAASPILALIGLFIGACAVLPIVTVETAVQAPRMSGIQFLLMFQLFPALSLSAISLAGRFRIRRSAD